MKKVLNISHTDMDGYSCCIVLNRKFKNFRFMNISYNKITETLEYLEEELPYSDTNVVIISDLNFSQQELLKLKTIIKDTPRITFMYFDHHDYSPKQKEVLENINKEPNGHILIDVNRCATKIVYDVFIKDKNPTTELFVNVVNAFDIWLKDTKYHRVGIDLNNYFWFIKGKSFFYQFKDFNINNEKFIKKAKSIRIQSNLHFLDLEKRGLSFVDDRIRLVMTDDYLGMVNTQYKEDIIIIGTSYGNFSVRLDGMINSDAHNIKEAVIRNLQNSPLFISGGGHDKAFGITFNSTVSGDYNLILEIFKKIFKIIKEERDDLEEIPF